MTQTRASVLPTFTDGANDGQANKWATVMNKFCESPELQYLFTLLLLVQDHANLTRFGQAALPVESYGSMLDDNPIVT